MVIAGDRDRNSADPPPPKRHCVGSAPFASTSPSSSSAEAGPASWPVVVPPRAVGFADLPPELLDAVFCRLWLLGTRDTPQVVGGEHDGLRGESHATAPLVTAASWAAVAPAAAVCTRFRRAFLGTVRRLEVRLDEAVVGRFAVRTNPDSLPVSRCALARAGTATQVLIEHVADVRRLLPKLPHLASLVVHYIHAAGVQWLPLPAWVPHHLHRELLTVASAMPSVVSLKWSGNAVVAPSVLGALGDCNRRDVGGGGIKSLTIGGLDVNAAMPGAVEGARARLQRLLMRLAPTLRVLRLREFCCNSLRLEGAASAATFIAGVGRMPQLVELAISFSTLDPHADGGGGGAALAAAAAAAAAAPLPDQFPALKRLQIRNLVGSGVSVLANLCRPAQLATVQLLAPMAVDTGALVAALATSPVSPRKLVLSYGVEWDCLPAARWGEALAATEELYLGFAVELRDVDGNPVEAASTPLTPSAMMVLNALPSLKSLRLTNATLHGEAVMAASLPHIESLTLFTPIFFSGAAAALVHALARRSPRLAALNVARGWQGHLASGLYVAVGLPALRALSVKGTVLPANDDESAATALAIGALRATRPEARVVWTGEAEGG